MDSDFSLRGLVGRRWTLLRRAGSGAGTALRALFGPISSGGDLVGCRQALLRGQGLGHLRVGSALMDLVTAGGLCFEGLG